jgi:hypothetical protein
MLIFAVILAGGHHTFNAWEDGALVYNSPMYNSPIQPLLVLFKLTYCLLVQIVEYRNAGYRNTG